MSASADPLFSWKLNQERVDLLAAILRKAELVFREVDPYCLAAERVAYLLQNLREDCCERGGAADPFPYLPMVPRFDETATAERERACE